MSCNCRTYSIEILTSIKCDLLNESNPIFLMNNMLEYIHYLGTFITVYLYISAIENFVVINCQQSFYYDNKYHFLISNIYHKQFPKLFCSFLGNI